MNHFIAPEPMFRAAAVAAVLLAAGGTSALAQSAGTYTGTNSQGKTVEVTLADEGAGLRITSLLMFWSADCTRSGPGRDVAWGVGAQEPVTGGSQTYEFRGNGLYERWTLNFDGSAVTGTFTARTPEFTDVATSTRSVQLCNSGSLTFSANLQPVPSLQPTLKAGEAVQLR
jgi:hypothetical protein